MKNIILLASVLAVTACTSTDHKNPAFLGPVWLKEWPEEHWQGQNYRPTVTDYQNQMPSLAKQSPTMFDSVMGVSPQEFVDRLKKAEIITRVYNEKSGVLNRTETGTVIVEVGANFYALSSTDQSNICELLTRSYQKDTYLLKDAKTQQTVGQITPLGVNLF